MKGLYSLIALVISFGICFNIPYQFNISEVALNWIFFALLLILLGTFKFVFPSSLDRTKHCLSNMQTKKASHWSDVFGLNVREWTSLFIVLAPFSIIILGISRSVTHLIPMISFINYFALLVPSVLAMIIFFMILSVGYHKKINKNKEVHPAV